MSLLFLSLACVVVPIVLIVALIFLVKWLVQSQNLSKTAVMVFFPASLSIASLFLLNLLWAQSMLTNYSSVATVAAYSVEIVDNSWWIANYGDDYSIGDDRYIASFCIPHQQFALVSMQWECPLFKTCTGNIVAWDCGHRDICQDDCVVLADDGYYDDDNGGQQNKCYSSNGDDDAANADDANGDDANANDANADDDEGNANNNDDDGKTEEDMLTCAANSYAVGSTESIITDCSKCSVLTEEDHAWTREDQVPSHYLPMSIFGATAALSALAAMIIYHCQSGDEEEEYDGDDNDSDFQLVKDNGVLT
jgi:hypothetical protein